MLFNDPAHASVELIGYGFLAFGVVMFLSIYVANRLQDGHRSNG